MCVCVRACMRARACVRVCVRACACVYVCSASMGCLPWSVQIASKEVLIGPYTGPYTHPSLCCTFTQCCSRNPRIFFCFFVFCLTGESEYYLCKYFLASRCKLVLNNPLSFFDGSTFCFIPARLEIEVEAGEAVPVPVQRHAGEFTVERFHLYSAR